MAAAGRIGLLAGLFDLKDAVYGLIDKDLPDAAGPADLNFLDELVFAKAKMHTRIAG